ncbi:MAG: nucleotidyltransferase domain-containing protein [bacterium]
MAREESKQRVLNSKFGNHIAKIILFGSVLREKADKDSDIDVMIFSANKTDEVESFLNDTDSIVSHHSITTPLQSPINTNAPQ